MKVKELIIKGLKNKIIIFALIAIIAAGLLVFFYNGDTELDTTYIIAKLEKI